MDLDIPLGTTLLLNDTLLSSTTNSNANGFTEDQFWPVRDELYIVIPITIVYSVIFIVGLVGNIMTMVVIIRSRYLHTATNYFLFSLAISDLVLLCFGVPPEMVSIWMRYPDVFGETFCVLKGLASESGANATILTITAFSIERYLAICRPFLIQKLQNKLSRVVKQILFIWALSIGLAIPQALQLGLVMTQVTPDQHVLTCNVKRIIIQHSFEIATFVLFVFPMIVITALYLLIGMALISSHSSNAPPTTANGMDGKMRLRKSHSGRKREIGQQRVLKMLEFLESESSSVPAFYPRLYGPFS